MRNNADMRIGRLSFFVLLPLLADGYRLPSHGYRLPSHGRRRAVIRANAEDPPPAPPPFDAPADTADDSDAVVLGSRILGACVGGYAGNSLFSSLQRIGLDACTPFNKGGCANLLRQQQEQRLAAQQQLTALLTVPPASAAPEPGGLYDASTQLDPSVATSAATSSLDLIGFSALAEGGGPGLLFATFVFAAFGAVAFETLATNEAAPIPDPLLGGVWGTLHSLVRGPSKFVGVAAAKAFDVVKGLVAGQLNQ